MLKRWSLRWRVVMSQKWSLMEGEWSCYRCWSGLMEGEWLCYGGGQFNGGRKVMLGGQFNGGRMVMLRRWSV